MLTKKDFIASVPLPDMKTISIRVQRPFYYKGELQAVGSTLDYPYALALEVINLGKAERAPTELPVMAEVTSETSTETFVAPRRGRPPKPKEE